MSIIIHFFQDESGATAIEYGLIAALVVLVADPFVDELFGHLRGQISAVFQGDLGEH